VGQKLTNPKEYQTPIVQPSVGQTNPISQPNQFQKPDKFEPPSTARVPTTVVTTPPQPTNPQLLQQTTSTVPQTQSTIPMAPLGQINNPNSNHI
jgi:hypothetical protein